MVKPLPGHYKKEKSVNWKFGDEEINRKIQKY